MHKHFIRAIICVVLLSTILSAQSSFDFLHLDASPRAAAVAGSYVANGDDPNVIFYNPAGINLLTGTPVSFSFLKHLMDINSASISFSKEIEGIGRFAAGIQYINYGSFTRADENGMKLGNFGAGDIAFIIGYGNQLDKNFYYGANIKFLYSSIESYSSSAAAIDLGLHYAIPELRWNFGFSVLNLGSQISNYFNTKEDLPLDIRLGFSKGLEKLPFTFFWSFNRLNERYDNFFERFKQITLGGELRVGQNLKLRLGYDNEKRKEMKLGSTSAGLAGFSVGLGFIVNKYNVDYSFSSLGSVGALHRFGISTSL
ncbi:MAG: type IX secretion system protein PorQ [Ignavibacteriales bacterium]|nr:type IX secretion system protein PorQ [Ignavibacteriales bacterium]